LVEKDLAAYARPIFIRILPEQQLTGTFKLQKGDLREAAFHPDRCADDIYGWKTGAAGYEKLDCAYSEKVMAAEAGF
jgi:citronellyl-CoA synthetase